MSGHASQSEREMIELLERTVGKDRPPIEDALRLAVLYIEPSHRESEAIRVLEGILKRDPKHQAARLWLAYCLVHYVMDREALLVAKGLLETLIADRGELIGPASMLLVEALDELGELPTEKRVTLLESSVHHEPTWVYNRTRLARAYKDAGRMTDAISEMQAARANARDPVELDPITRAFEDAFTGRYYSRQYLDEEYRQLNDAGEGRFRA